MENLIVKTTADNGLITVREGKAPDELPNLAPLKIDINGVLNAPLKWIEKRSIVQDEANVTFDRVKREIILNTCEKDGYHKEVIKGTLHEHSDVALWKINQGHCFTNFQLADLIKMNRGYFENKEVAMGLVADLKNFKVKVSKELEKADNNRGDKTQLNKQVIIDNNLPEKFRIKIGVFKGYPPEYIEVEVYVDADNFNCALVSPELTETGKFIADNAIDDVIKAIKVLTPDLVVIEI